MFERDGCFFAGWEACFLTMTATLCLAGRATADEPADAPLPGVTPAQLAARLRDAMARYDDRGTFRVLFTDTLDLNNYAPGRPTWKEDRPLLVSYRGRARYDGDGSRWRVDYDSMKPAYGSDRLYPDRWSSGFDGARHYRWIAKIVLFLGESAPEARRWAPRSVIWEGGEPLIRMLEDADHGRASIEISQRLVDGVRCYVVEGRTPDGRSGAEAILSPRQGYLPIGRTSTRLGTTESSRSLRGVREIIPGLWAPERIEEELTTVRDDGASRFHLRRRIQVAEYRPRQVPLESTFRIVIPYGIDLVDRPAGSAYHNDPWWPEVGAMLRERFGWPPPDFSPLGEIGSYSERKIDGQPAPPLRIATWLNARPMDLATLRGKVVLIEFGDIGYDDEPRYTCALRELYSAYHPAGLEILSIHAPDADASEVRRFARDYRLPYPVAIDEGRPGSPGATAHAFAIKGRIRAFLIDHEGRVRPIREPGSGRGRVVGTIVSLLKASGAHDVKPISLESPRLPDEAYKAADLLFQTRVKQALDARLHGMITGRVVDENRRPIPDASVRARLRLWVMPSTTPGAGWFNIPYRAPDDRFVARSGADGRFELTGLCKGAYILTVESPGRAWAGRMVFLAPDLRPVPVEIALNQGDSIAGQVRDHQGKPIANANVIPTWRQHFEDGEFRFNEDMRHLRVTADEAGRFRLADLEQGLYSIQFKAFGFKDRELEAIPAGEQNVAATLERAP
jgi:hypothetical protein